MWPFPWGQLCTRSSCWSVQGAKREQLRCGCLHRSGHIKLEISPTRCHWDLGTCQQLVTPPSGLLERVLKRFSNIVGTGLSGQNNFISFSFAFLWATALTCISALPLFYDISVRISGGNFKILHTTKLAQVVIWNSLVFHMSPLASTSLL